MQEVESVAQADSGRTPDSKRPDEHLLVKSHLADVIPPEVYLGIDIQFVDFVQGRANVRLRGSCVHCAAWCDETVGLHRPVKFNITCRRSSGGRQESWSN